MSLKQQILSELTQLAEDQTQSETERLQAKAARMILTGDLDAASQAIEACKIPAADWAAAKSGTLDY